MNNKDNQVNEYEEEEEEEELEDGDFEEEEDEEEEIEIDYPEEAEDSVVIDYDNVDTLRTEPNPASNRTNNVEKTTIINDKNETMRKLLDTNLAEVPKEELIELLLNSVKLDEEIKETKKVNKKYQNIQSHYNSEKLKNNNSNTKVQVSTSRDNPEFTNDFNTACIKVFAKMSADEKNKDLLNILVADKELLQSEIGKLDINRKYIENKLNTYYIKKQKKLDEINAKLNEDFQKNCKFVPNLQTEKTERRNLDQFLKDQENHLKKIDEKLKNKQKDDKDESVHHPKIDINSQKIYESKIRTEEPTFMRLYKKRFKNEKKNLLEKKKKKKLVDIKKNEEHLKSLYEKGLDKQNRLDELKEKVISEESKQIDKYFESNKIMISSISRKFNEVLENLNENLSLDDLILVLNNLGFTTVDGDNITERQVLKTQEKKLINEIYEELKNEDNLVNKNNLFIFILAVVNCFKYYMYYKRNGKNKELLDQIKKELDESVKKFSKYGGWDENSNYVITFDKEKLINKEFKIFYINYSNSIALSAKNKKKHIQPEPSFKPTINPNSNKLCNEYRRKVFTLEDATPSQKKELHIQNQVQYFDKVVMKMNYKKNEYAKIKEEQIKTEMAQCTFKPNIIENYKFETNDPERENQPRYKALYDMGTKNLSNRKNKTKEEYELDVNGRECSFMPDTSKPIKENRPSNISNDIYNEPNYDLFYSRLINGRIERHLKESVHSRYDFPKELINNPKSNSVERCVSPSKFRSESVKEKVEETQTNESEKKDSLPLLIIDVNVKPGVKKKIYVYDGDTAEGLADKFAKEHNLDTDTKNKLTLLVKNHMSKLLMKIDEENNSVLDKSNQLN